MSRTHRAPATSTLGDNPAWLAIKEVVTPTTTGDAAPEMTRADLLDESNDKVIFEGNVMYRMEVNTILAKRDKERHGTSYFDLLDFIKDKISNSLMLARVLSSQAWMLDSTIISTARTVFYDVFKEASAVGHIDNFAEFLSKMSELRANEAYAEDLGFELGAGRLAALNQMIHLSKEWHDAAESAAVHAGVKYDPKSFEMLMASEKPQAVDILTRTKLKSLVEVTYEGEDVTAEEVEQASEALINQQVERNRLMHESRQLVGPAVLRIIDNAAHADCEEAAFWQLPVDTQKRLILAGAKAVERTVVDLSSYKSISTIEYLGIIREGKAASKELTTIAHSGKFIEH